MGRLWAVMGVFWVLFGVSWVPLGIPWAFEPPFVSLWVFFGVSLGPFGSIGPPLVSLGVPFETFGLIVGSPMAF